MSQDAVRDDVQPIDQIAPVQDQEIDPKDVTEQQAAGGEGDGGDAS